MARLQQEDIINIPQLTFFAAIAALPLMAAAEDIVVVAPAHVARFPRRRPPTQHTDRAGVIGMHTKWGSRLRGNDVAGIIRRRGR
jgi:hypothetical protein